MARPSSLVRKRPGVYVDPISLYGLRRSTRKARKTAPWYWHKPKTPWIARAWHKTRRGALLDLDAHLRRGVRAVGTMEHTDNRIFKPIPWPPFETEADDHYCPVHDESYRSFRSGITQAQAAAYLRDHGGELGAGSTGAYGTKARQRDVLKLMGTLKTNAWRERHGSCQHEAADPDAWTPDWEAQWAHDIAAQRSGKERICIEHRHKAPTCFMATPRKSTGRGRPPHGGADCRRVRDGEYSSTCSSGRTVPVLPGPRFKR